MRPQVVEQLARSISQEWFDLGRKPQTFKALL